MRITAIFLALPVLLAFSDPAQAATIQLANGGNWDVNDVEHTVFTPKDTGSIVDGYNDAYDRWGHLHLRVMDTSNNIIGTSGILNGFALTHDGNRSWNTLTPVVSNEISVNRTLFAPSGTNYMRYLDSFTNTASTALRVIVAWGGDLGSDVRTTVAATSSGDLNFTAADNWGVTFEDDGLVLYGPPGNQTFGVPGVPRDPPVGFVRGTSNLIGLGSQDVNDNENPFDRPWPGTLPLVSTGEDDLNFLYQFDLNPGETGRLVNFLSHGLSEAKTQQDGSQPPAQGTQIASVTATVAALFAAPDFSGISAGDMATVKNWAPAAVPEPSTLVLWSVGAAAVGIRRRARRRGDATAG
ncbi:MAG: PEP-CTERM sorting domain-containing protein [Pirellulaceae bacterium]